MTGAFDDEAMQRAVRDFLADPATHGGAAVGVVETHANTVFLAGPRAYKMKRAVEFPFLDYSTLPLREAACRREIEVNRGEAAAIYRGVVAVRRGADGRLALDESGAGAGEAVEWLVAMNRFDETATLDRRLETGPPLGDDEVVRLAETIAAAQGDAPRREAAPWIADLGAYVEQNDAAFRAAPELYPPDRVAALAQAARAWHGRLAALLAERGRLGFVRLLHGDLHAGNVAMIDGRPVPFDAIEFDDAIATADLLYDAGFLIMDLDERGQARAANLLVERVLTETVRRAAAQDPAADPAALLVRHVEGLAALPFFLSLRAAIRSKVTLARAEHLDAAGRERALSAARRYFDLALAYLDPAEPVLVAVGGLSGTGKSTLARALAPRLGRRPGALHLRSDVVRKLLARAGDTERLAPASYTREASAAVYAALGSAARAGLAAGFAVVVDAVAAQPAERDGFAAIAAGVEAGFVGLWLEAPTAARLDRVDARSGDASDADRTVVFGQAALAAGPVGWTRIDAGGDPQATLARALAVLQAAGVAVRSEPE